MACALLLALVPLAVHAHKYPDFSGFWAGSDQHRYLEAARAWAEGDLSPARHHYLPLYPLMGAAFVWLTPWQPFLVPDLACLLASFFLFIAIGRRLAPGWPPAALAASFVVGVFSGRTDAAIWVVPWSTTGAAPFQFLALLLSLRFLEQPSPGRAAALGAALGVIAGFRPSDAAVLLVTCGAMAGGALLVRRTQARQCVRLAAAGALGLAAGLAPTLVAHSVIFGLSAGPYVRESAGIGFEPRLLAMRWVMIVLGSRPLLPEGAGLAWSLPWFVPGVFGLLAGALLPKRRAAFWLVASTVCLHWALYLSYRDLQPYGLWRFYNIHYFKWTFPFLTLWAAQLVAALAGRATRPRALAACGAACLLFVWRPILRAPVQIPAASPGLRTVIPTGALQLDRAVQVPVEAAWGDIYFAPARLTISGATFYNTRDFKLFPIPSAALLIPLRRLPDGPASLELPGLSVTGALTVWRQAIVLALPCITRRLPGCA